ncbi:hypothetical protein GN956_G8936 [Arapaima gigas]
MLFDLLWFTIRPPTCRECRQKLGEQGTEDQLLKCDGLPLHQQHEMKRRWVLTSLAIIRPGGILCSLF